MININKGFYIIFLGVLMLFSPLACFLVCLRFYKSYISQGFMLLFAFYFGYNMSFSHDIAMHYYDFVSFARQDFTTAMSSEYHNWMGTEPYHKLLKFILSRFTTDSQVFGGVLSTIYAAFFLLFFNQFRTFFKEKMSIFSTILLICVVAVVEFYWYQGVRFWVGAFFFAGFYLRFINTRRRRFFIIALLCPFFHYSLVMLDLIVVAVYFLNKNSIIKLLWILLIVSYLTSMFKFDLYSIVDSLHDYDLFLFIDTSDYRLNSFAKRAQHFQEEGNIIYMYRTAIATFIGMFLLLIFKRFKMNFNNKYRVLLVFFLVTQILVNVFGGSYVFHDRYGKIALLFLYSYLFIMSVIEFVRIRRRTLFLMALSSVTAVYLLATPIIEMRNTLFDPELLFGNVFIHKTGDQVRFRANGRERF